MMNGCDKCMKLCGAVFLLSGVAFLLRDLDIWDFWNIQWYTVLFIFWGIGAFAMMKCPDCQAMRKSKK